MKIGNKIWIISPKVPKSKAPKCFNNRIKIEKGKKLTHFFCVHSKSFFNLTFMAYFRLFSHEWLWGIFFLLFSFFFSRAKQFCQICKCGITRSEVAFIFRVRQKSPRNISWFCVFWEESFSCKQGNRWWKFSSVGEVMKSLIFRGFCKICLSNKAQIFFWPWNFFLSSGEMKAKILFLEKFFKTFFWWKRDRLWWNFIVFITLNFL